MGKISKIQGIVQSGKTRRNGNCLEGFGDLRLGLAMSSPRN